MQYVKYKKNRLHSFSHLNMFMTTTDAAGQTPDAFIYLKLTYKPKDQVTLKLTFKPKAQVSLKPLNYDASSPDGWLVG